MPDSMSVANGQAPYTWSVSGPASLASGTTTDPANTLTYSGTNAETVVVTVVDARGCSDSASIND